MIGIGIPISQASMPFMGILRLVVRADNAEEGGLVPLARHETSGA